MRMVLRSTTDKAMGALQVTQGSSHLHPQGVKLNKRHFGNHALLGAGYYFGWVDHVDEISLAKGNAWFQEIWAAARKLILFLK
tara:strand:- start:263 stop:511 length:249 start_codon:yes stop_codon:yes gene_type:complete